MGVRKGRKGWGKSNAVDLVLWCCQLVSGCHALQWTLGLSNSVKLRLCFGSRPEKRGYGGNDISLVLPGFGFVFLAVTFWRWGRESLLKQKSKLQKIILKSRAAWIFTGKLISLEITFWLFKNCFIILINVVREKGMLGKDFLDKIFPYPLVESLLF